MSLLAPGSEPANRAHEFVKMLHDHYASYHNHKESMAYAGFTAFVGIVAAALFTDAWPPPVNELSRPLSVAGVMALWYVMLIYLKFQLLRRRWAALRQAGCERLLARWIPNPPVGELETWSPQPSTDANHLITLIDWIFPLKDAVRAVKPDQAVYPRALVDEWKAREKEGTEAIQHERLILWTGWVLYLLLIADTVLRAA